LALRRRPFVPRLEALECRALPSTVWSSQDSGPGSLRDAIASAGDGDTIVFDPSLAGQTITLTSGELAITKSLDIEGLGAKKLAVSGNGQSQVFDVNTSGGTVTLAGLTIENGTGMYGGGIDNEGGTLTVSQCALSGNSAWRGGAINNFGSLTVSDSTLSGNSASNNGGGIANFGPLTVSHSTLAGNSTGSLGGAIYNFGSASLTVTDSNLSGNAAGFGGAIANNSGTVAVTSSTVASNSALVGGGIFNGYGGTVTVTASTFASNTASYAGGGGIDNDSGAVLTVINSTFASNQATTGGGIDNNAAAALTVTSSTFAGNAATTGGGIADAGTMAARNTILAGNTAATGADLSGDLGSQGHNLIGDTGGGVGFAASDLLNVDPVLGPLQDNGGPTATMSLLPGSPAVDAGDNTGAPDWDQRGPGFPRIVGGTIDIGAFEVQAGVATQLVVSAPAGVMAGVPFDVTVTALDAYAHVASGYLGTVTFTTTDLDPGVVLPPGYAFTTNDAGTHTFAGVTTLLTAGTQTLTATDAANGDLVGSFPVTVTPPDR
jgi:hypothetical protein